MNLIFTCGGTAGHINPAIAVANMMRERDPEGKILFIGAVDGMEEQLIPKAGYDLVTLPGSGLSRKLNAAGIKKNIHAVKCVVNAVAKCKKIIRDFEADVIVGTGGYASFPAIYAGSRLGIPTVVHESNALPGLTTKLAAGVASKVMVCFEESVKHYKNPENVEVVGMPVRQEFITTGKTEAKKLLSERGKDYAKLITEKLNTLTHTNTRAQAEAEVIADACEMMLKDSAAAETMAKSNPSLWKTMTNWLKDFVTSFARRVKRAFSGITATSEEAQALTDIRDGVERYVGNIQKIWDNALVEAVGRETADEVTEKKADVVEERAYSYAGRRSKTADSGL